MKKYFVSFLMMLTAVCALGQQPVLFTPGQLLEDHGILVRALKELHPGLYRYMSKEEFNALDRQIMAKLNKPMTEEAYYQLMMPLIAKLKCGHTKWHRKDRPDDRYAFQQENLFPLKLYFRDNRAFVLKSYHPEDSLPGATEIVSINGKKVPDLIRELHRFITIDGNVQSALYSELNQSFNGYYATFIGTAPMYTVEFIQGGRKRQIRLGKVSLALIRAAEEKDKQHRQAMELTMPRAGVAVLRIDRFYTIYRQRVSCHQKCWSKNPGDRSSQ
ncbi:MAG: hypothetical protein EOO01_41440 [Chitinophagaceae bacterium]|nr:MAG: hypothetical protein EOO01_41440 [Chitinophagaceae bacterium]